MGAAQNAPPNPEKQITVSKENAQIVSLVLEDFTVGPGATQKDVESVYRVLEQDLGFSNYFEITRVPQLLAGDPVGISGKAVVRGSVEMARGQLVLRGVLESLPGRSRILSRDYATKPEWYREAAHRFTDDIVHFLTGDTGIARTKIAYVSNKTGNKEIYVVDYDGFGVRQVTHNRSINMSPAWSPDMRQIVYTSFKKGDPDIYVIDLATGKPLKFEVVTGAQAKTDSPAETFSVWPVAALKASPSWASGAAKLAATATDTSPARALAVKPASAAAINIDDTLGGQVFIGRVIACLVSRPLAPRSGPGCYPCGSKSAYRRSSVVA